MSEGPNRRDQGGASTGSSGAQNPTGGAQGRRGGEQPSLHHNLMERVLSPENLHRAWKRVEANKGAPGIDGVPVEAFREWARIHWPAARQALEDGAYQPQPVRRVTIPKAGGGERMLGIPTVMDRVIQQAIAQVLTPIFDPGFSESSHGFREQRSAHGALKQIKRYVTEEDRRVAVDLDLAKFFDNVNHDILLNRLARKIGDKRLLALIGSYLRAGVAHGDRVQPSEIGTPQGGPLSPLLANILLDDLDKELERRGHKFARYADDSAPRRRARRAQLSEQLCCTRDGGRPPEVAVQAEASNHPLLLPLREVVVSELGKGRARPCQVWTVESNASEPLMTYRKRRDVVKTEGVSLPRDKFGRHLSTARSATGMKAARRRPRLLCGTWEPVTPMPRETTKGKPPEVQSTDAGYRGGATRSSVEGAVMALERRGCPIRPETIGQPFEGGAL